MLWNNNEMVYQILVQGLYHVTTSIHIHIHTKHAFSLPNHWCHYQKCFLPYATDMHQKHMYLLFFRDIPVDVKTRWNEGKRKEGNRKKKRNSDWHFTTATFPQETSLILFAILKSYVRHHLHNTHDKKLYILLKLQTLHTFIKCRLWSHRSCFKQSWELKKKIK